MEASQVVSELSSSLLSSGMFTGDVNYCISELSSPELPSLQEALEKGLNAFKCKQQEVCEQWCEVVLDYTWEKLHSGVWSDVSIGWRKLYALSSLLKAMSIASRENESLDTALLALDKGILLGAPVLGGALNSLAASLSFHIKQTKLSAVDGKSVIAPPPNPPPSQGEQSTSVKRREIKLRNYKSVKLNEKDSDDDISVSTKRLKSGTDMAPDISTPLKHSPSLNEFLSHHMRSSEPAVLTGCMEHWPALSCRKWSLGYIHGVAGARTVPVEIGSKYTDENWRQELMTVSSFIDRFIINENEQTGKGYVAQHQLFDQIDELRRDICIPDYCCLSLNDSSSASLDDTSDNAVQINAWFGPGETVSPLHYDPKHNLLCQVFGRKYIKLFSAAQTPYLYPHTNIMSNTSQVNVEDPDIDKFPLFLQAQPMECVLEPGQMLYIPPKCWHFVKSLDISFSVSFWWE